MTMRSNKTKKRTSLLRAPHDQDPRTSSSHTGVAMYITKNNKISSASSSSESYETMGEQQVLPSEDEKPCKTPKMMNNEASSSFCFGLQERLSASFTSALSSSFQKNVALDDGDGSCSSATADTHGQQEDLQLVEQEQEDELFYYDCSYQEQEEDLVLVDNEKNKNNASSISLLGSPPTGARSMLNKIPPRTTYKNKYREKQDEEHLFCYLSSSDSSLEDDDDSYRPSDARMSFCSPRQEQEATATSSRTTTTSPGGGIVYLTTTTATATTATTPRPPPPPYYSGLLLSDPTSQQLVQLPVKQDDHFLVDSPLVGDNLRGMYCVSPVYGGRGAGYGGHLVGPQEEDTTTSIRSFSSTTSSSATSTGVVVMNDEEDGNSTKMVLGAESDPTTCTNHCATRNGIPSPSRVARQDSGGRVVEAAETTRDTHGIRTTAGRTATTTAWDSDSRTTTTGATAVSTSKLPLLYFGGGDRREDGDKSLFPPPLPPPPRDSRSNQNNKQGGEAPSPYRSLLPRRSGGGGFCNVSDLLRLSGNLAPPPSLVISPPQQEVLVVGNKNRSGEAAVKSNKNNNVLLGATSRVQEEADASSEEAGIRRMTISGQQHDVQDAAVRLLGGGGRQGDDTRQAHAERRYKNDTMKKELIVLEQKPQQPEEIEKDKSVSKKNGFLNNKTETLKKIHPKQQHHDACRLLPPPPIPNNGKEERKGAIFSALPDPKENQALVQNTTCSEAITKSDLSSEGDPKSPDSRMSLFSLQARAAGAFHSTSTTATTTTTRNHQGTAILSGATGSLEGEAFPGLCYYLKNKNAKPTMPLVGTARASYCPPLPRPTITPALISQLLQQNNHQSNESSTTRSVNVLRGAVANSNMPYYNPNNTILASSAGNMATTLRGTRQPEWNMLSNNGGNGIHTTNTTSSAASLVHNNGPVAKRHHATKRFYESQLQTWTLRLEEAKEFRRVHGHCRIPHSLPSNQELARWAKRQRYQYKLLLSSPPKRILTATDRLSTLTAERIEALERIGFCWDVRSFCWFDHFEELRLFVQKNGHANVAFTTKRKGHDKKLAVWVKSQRYQHKLWKKSGFKTGVMNKERESLLNSLGFEWCRLPDTTAVVVGEGQKKNKKRSKGNNDRGNKKKTKGLL